MATKTTARKKKIKRSFTKGVAHIHSTFNNTIVTISDEAGNVISWSSAGALGFKGAKKSTPFAAQLAGEAAGKVAFDQGIRTVDVDVKGPGSGREGAVRALANVGLTVTSITDSTPVPHNGCRPLPIKVNSAGVIPVIFASSIMMTPTVIASFISSDTPKWLGIFSYTEMYDMGSWKMPWGLLIYITLIMLFAFFYATLQIDPEQLAENFRKNGSYIPGVRPGNETERYVKKVVNRVTCIGALALTFIAALPVVLSLSGLFGNNSSLAIGGTGLIKCHHR